MPSLSSFATGCALLGLLSTPLLADELNVDDAVGPYTLWTYHNEDTGERVTLIDVDDDVYGINGREEDAALLSDRAAEKALRHLDQQLENQTVAVVEVDKGATDGLDIQAQGEDGEEVRIVIGNSIVLVGGSDGENNFSFSFGENDAGHTAKAHKASPAVRIHADADHQQEGGLVIVRGATREEARDFVDELDEIPARVRRELANAAGL